MKEYLQEHINGILGTIAFHVAVALIMLSIKMVKFEPIFPDNPEGVEVNFGTDDTGFGDVEPGSGNNSDDFASQETSQEATQEATTPPEEVTESQDVVDAPPQQVVKQEVVTQNFEDAPAVAEKKRIEQQKLEQKKKDDETERIRQQEEARVAEENQRIEAENQRIAAEKQKKAQEKQTMAGKLFGKGTGEGSSGIGSGNGSQGIAGGEGNQGQPNGVAGAPNYVGGGGKGVGYSLSNRSAVDLPHPPKGIQAEGKVVVEILVDRNGKVVDARPGVKGTNTNNERLYQASKEAALKTKFNVSANAPERQKGTLTYIFELQ